MRRFRWFMGGEKWYYWSEIDNDERILLECYDSDKGGRVPHTAFVDPRSPPGAKQKEREY